MAEIEGASWSIVIVLLITLLIGINKYYEQENKRVLENYQYKWNKFEEGDYSYSFI